MEYEKQINHHNLANRALLIERHSTIPLSLTHQQQYNVLDQQRMLHSAAAEKKCRKLRMGNVPYNPKFRTAETAIAFWNGLIKIKSNRKFSSRLLERKRKQADICTDTTVMTLTQAKTERHQAYKHYYAVKQTAAEDRGTWREELAQAQADAGNLSQATYLRRQATTEAQRLSSRRIKRVTGKTRTAGLTAVQIERTTTDEYGITTTIVEELTTKEEIEEVLFDSNEDRYRVACPSPMNQFPLVEDFGFLGVGPAAQQVFDGTYQPPIGTDPYAIKFLQSLKMEPQVANSKRPPPVVSNDVYRQCWKNAKERTSAHNDGYHYGMGKAGCESDLITTFESVMNNIPMTTGHSPSSYRNATDVMLQKKVGVILANKLRIIKLFNTQFNINNKILAKHMMYHAEDLNQFPDEQAGSRKRMRAIIQGLNKTLTFDLIRQRRKPAALCSNDAQACYDQIAHTAASLAMQSIGGLPAPPLICMFTTLQNLENSVRTAYGDSSNTYGGAIWLVPMQGIGQGNGIGPATWAVASTPLLKILKKEGHGLCYHTALTNDKIQILSVAH